MWPRTALVAALAIGVVVSAHPALAVGGPAGSAAEAAQDFALAQRRFDAKDYAGALELFRKSFEASGSPNAHLYVARCLREMGKLAEAYEEMRATSREATARAQSEAKYAPTRDAAAAELALLEPQVGKIVVAIADPPSGTEVTVNGAPLAADRVGAPFAVAPGKLHIVVKAPGESTVDSDVDVGAGQTKTVTLSFNKHVAPVSGPATESPAADAEPSGGGVRTAGFVVLGLGVVGVAVFAVAGSMASAKFSTLEEECGGTRCTDPKYADTVDSGKTLDLVANIGLVAGGAGVLAGTLMIALGGPKRAPGSSPGFLLPSSRAASLTVSPTGAAVRCDF